LSNIEKSSEKEFSAPKENSGKNKVSDTNTNNSQRKEAGALIVK